MMLNPKHVSVSKPPSLWYFVMASPADGYSALKQQKFILSQFWRPEVLTQGVSRVGLCCRL